jgi:hypothetical protein
MDEYRSGRQERRDEGIQQRQTWCQNAAVRLGEEHGHTPTEWGQVVPVRVWQAGNETLAAESAQIIGGLATGVGLVPQAGDQLDELLVARAGKHVAEVHHGGQQCHHPRVAEGQRWGRQALLARRGPGHMGACDRPL